MHPHTIRKRIKAGKLEASLLDGPNGPEYRIPVHVVHQLAAEVMAERGQGQRQRSAAGSVTLNGGGSATPSAGGLTDIGSGVDSPSDSGFHDEDGPSADSESVGREAGANALAIARAQEMAAYTQRLLEPLQAQLAGQAEELGRLKAELRMAQQQVTGQERSAEEVGRLKAELEQARARLAEFEALTDELERQQAAAGGDGGRPWWRFWSK
jgi:hypothetical protein